VVVFTVYGSGIAFRASFWTTTKANNRVKGRGRGRPRHTGDRDRYWWNVHRLRLGGRRRAQDFEGVLYAR